MEAGTQDIVTDGKDSGSGSAVWKDITEECRAAARSLGTGEMICAPSFSLFESMSALELMDPKMDESLLEPVEGVSSRLARGELPIQVSLTQAARIVGGMLAYEVAWYEGASLLDSLFLCLYPHGAAIHALCSMVGVKRGEQKEEDGEEEGKKGSGGNGGNGAGGGPIMRDAISEDPACMPALVLLALVFGTLKSVGAFREVILDADIYEEEDAHPNSLGLYLGENLLLEDAVFLLEKSRASLASLLEGGREGGREGGEGEAEAIQSLLAHLSFRLALLKMQALLLSFSPALGEMEGATLHKALAEALAALERVKEEEEKEEEEEGKEEEKERGKLGSVAFAFDRGITRALKGNAPRRVIRIPSQSQALERFRQLLLELQESLQAFAFDVNHEVFSLQRLRMVLEELAASSPGIIARSFLHRHLVKEEEDLLLGRFPFSLSIAEHMQGMGLPLGLVYSDQCHTFILSAAKTLAEGLRGFCHNRARQRVRLEVLFQDLGVLQEQAASLDADFRMLNQLPDKSTSFLVQWIMEEALRGMQAYIQLGFELELYADVEAEAVLWYLDCVLSIRLQLLSSLENQRLELEHLRRKSEQAARAKGKEERKSSGATAATGVAAKGGGKKKKVRDKRGKAGGRKELQGEEEEEEEEWRPTVRPDDDALAEAQISLSIQRLLARGTHLALTALGRARGHPPPPPPHGSAAWRFFHRFKAFSVLRYPEMLTYTDFRDNHQCWEEEEEEEEGMEGRKECGEAEEGGREEARGQVLEDAKGCFKAVKTLVDHGMRIKSHLKDEQGKAGLRDLARVAVSNSVVLMQAERALMVGETEGEGGKEARRKSRKMKRAKVSLTFAAHRQFPVLSVTVPE